MSHDPFDVLALPARFDLEPPVIEQAYLARVALNHPDLVSGDSDSVTSAAALNDARQTLLDPELRARALLLSLGFTDTSDALPDGFLMEIMDVRMQLEEATQSKNPEAIAKLRQWADDERRSYTSKVGELFAQLESADEPERADTVSALRTTLNAWRYIERMIEQAGTS